MDDKLKREGLERLKSKHDLLDMKVRDLRAKVHGMQRDLFVQERSLDGLAEQIRKLEQELNVNKEGYESNGEDNY